MKSLLKVGLTLGLVFLSTFIVIKATGVLTVDDIKEWLETAHRTSPHLIGIIISGILFADLFVAVPTLTTSIFGGYFLGFELGLFYVLLGYSLAGGVGYGISRLVGRRILTAVTKDESKIAEMDDLFHRHGLVVLSLARAVPILAEVSACLAGATRMPLGRFVLGWSINSVPYALIATYAGSTSSLDDPMPALYAAFGLTGVLWSAWYLFRRQLRKASAVQ